MNSEFLGRSDKIPGDFGLPPYHFHCRTMIVPVYVNKGENGERYTGIKAGHEAVRHIDKIGVERVLTKKTLKEHLKKHPESTIQNLIKALNSINTVAKNKDNNYINAWSDNGFFIVFDGNKVVTFFSFYFSE